MRVRTAAVFRRVVVFCVGVSLLIAGWGVLAPVSLGHVFYQEHPNSAKEPDKFPPFAAGDTYTNEEGANQAVDMKALYGSIQGVIFKFNDPNNNVGDITQIARQCGGGIADRWSSNFGVGLVDGTPTVIASSGAGDIFKVVDGENGIKQLPNSPSSANGLGWDGAAISPDGRYLQTTDKAKGNQVRTSYYDPSTGVSNEVKADPASGQAEWARREMASDMVVDNYGNTYALSFADGDSADPVIYRYNMDEMPNVKAESLCAREVNRC